MPFLIFFTVLCVVFLAFIGLTDDTHLGLLFFGIANFGYLISGSVFYNALLPFIADTRRIGRVSGYGISLSYVGTIAGLLLIKPIALEFGYQATFIPTALIFILFALPCFLFVKDKTEERPFSIGGLIRYSLKELIATLNYVMRTRGLFYFFLAVFIIINVVNAVFIFMSIYLKKVFLFSDAEIMALYIFSNIFSVIGAVSSGFAADKIGAKKTLTAAISLCCMAILLGVLSFNKKIFWIVGPMVGLAFSSIRVSGRAMAVELFPKEKIGEIFGHLGFLSNLAFVGILIWGGIVYLFAPFGALKYRIALSVMFAVLLIGIYTLQKAPVLKTAARTPS